MGSIYDRNGRKVGETISPYDDDGDCDYKTRGDGCLATIGMYITTWIIFIAVAVVIILLLVLLFS